MSDRITLHHGDCLDVLRNLPDASVDAVVTDPPYGLEFMGREWDGADGFRRSLNPADVGRDNPFGRTSRTSPEYRAGALFQEWCTAWARECLRVLKPGGHLLAFGGTRTWHRLACAVEDAGFEVRDSIAWLYGSGFPKSLDVSKAIDKAVGATGTYGEPKSAAHAGWIDRGRMRGGDGEEGWQRPWMQDADALSNAARKYEPGSPAAQQWQGWGTALKPAFEPIVVARKPLGGTVAANVLQYGTGALDIDACRVGEGGQLKWAKPRDMGYHGGTDSGPVEATTNPAGRWPTNVVLDDSQAAELDEQSGERKAGARPGNTAKTPKFNGSTYRVYDGRIDEPRQLLDSGGASRFFPTFRYEAKAPASERPFYYRPTCECEDAWPTHTPSAVRATDGTTAPASSSTSKSGSATTGDLSPTATRSTTSTATSSTTTPTTSSPSPRPTTSASTPAANSETATGGSRAAFAASSNPLAPVTGTSAVRGGRSTDDAARATSQGWSATSVCGECGAPTRREAHATVKPLDLMRWLVRLVTPPGGTVLDPFAGSGTTLEAALVEGFHAIGIEREADYIPLIRQRLARRRDPVEYLTTAGDDLGLFNLDGEGA